ncbi:tetratricopeptide repeat protein [Amycolatopsis taiwanensis]|uniref:Tetratricopeptide repeat protein n=1 Tax=Amycolatopsis taiwanensis TaxID=342230 RepID=A0A9W6QY57_9PSEU|nr:hypothetical protein [Amycolatopsis taiwanensis]GLY64936.1 hypothetical protein Atai01_15550 [Amycolatopsis taiwanensis]
MSPTESDLRELLQQASSLPYGETRDAHLENVLRHAEAGEFTRLAFDTRMKLIGSYAMGPARVRMFVPFARCLADYDANPAEYEPWVSHSLLWSFKHVVSAMTKFPEVPLARVETALDDMERRFRAGGHSLHAVYTYRHHAAEHVGDLPAADQWYDRWAQAPRDVLSDCIGCEPTDKAVYLSSRNRDEEAIAVAEPVLHDEHLTCSEQPQHILTALLLPYARTGRLAEARDAHRRAYRLLRTKPQDIEMLAHHLEFCARTGNEVAGLTLLERHLGWLDRASSPYAGMEFAASGALLLRRIEQAGHGTQRVRRPADGDRPATEPTVVELRETLARQALDTAARFDVRNATGYQTERVQALLDAESVAEGIPLSAIPRQPTPRTTAPAPTEDLTEKSAEELVERAERELLRQHPAVAKEVLRRHEPLKPDEDPVLAGRIMVLRARLATDPRGSAAEGDLRAAVALFEAAGDEDRRQNTLSRLGVVLCRTDRGAEGIPLLRAGVTHFDAAGDGAQRVWTRLRLIDGLVATGEPAEVEQLLAEADSIARECGDPLAIGAVGLERLDHYDGAAGQAETMIVVAEATAAAFREADVPIMVAGTGARLARLRQAVGDLDGALAEYRTALDALPADASPALRASMLHGQAELLMQANRPAEAISGLFDAVGLATLADEAELSAHCRHLLAVAYHATGQPWDSAELAEEALDAFEALGEAQAADRCRYLLARAHADLGEAEPALARYDEVIAHATQRGETDLLAQVLVDTAELLDRLDQDAMAAQRYREAGDLAQRSADPFHAAYCRYQEALSLMWSGNVPRAVEVLAEAEQAVADLPDEQPGVKAYHQAQLGANGARILHAADRLDDAVTHARGAVDGFRASGATHRIPGAELTLGNLLLQAGRAEEAEPWLRSAHDALSGEARAGEAARTALATALDQLGRSAEAAELRAEGDRAAE